MFYDGFSLKPVFQGQPQEALIPKRKRTKQPLAPERPSKPVIQPITPAEPIAKRWRSAYKPVFIWPESDDDEVSENVYKSVPRDLDEQMKRLKIIT